MSTHELKTWPLFFQNVKLGRKRFELRKNDRDFQEGDFLMLREWKDNGSPDGEYTGRTIAARVSYVLRDSDHVGVASGYCCMSIEVSP